ncbi:MAG: hypothetical protein LM577_05895 [Thermoproteaceae archaeon]|jgi:hypothetical protein|nr:hypothetical protein [Thermoproteaceae archaeon]
MQQVYERHVEVPIRISKRADEQTRLRRLERWPREAGESVVLDESGSTFRKLLQMYAADYKLEVGQRRWDVKSEGDAIRARLDVALLRGGEVRGRAVMEAEIPKTPTGEEGESLVYTARLRYYVEIDEGVLAEAAGSGFVEFPL